MKQRPEPIDQRLVKALAHPLRVRILEILAERVASPNSISEDIGAGLTHVAYHTRTLSSCGCLELVDTAQRRGATEHFYKAAPWAFLGNRMWRNVPRSVRAGVTGAALQSYMEVAVAALEAGAIDAREDSTLTWMPLRVDQRGWDEVAAILDEATDRILDAQSKCRQRLQGRRDEEEIETVFAVASFETAGSRQTV